MHQNLPFLLVLNIFNTALDQLCSVPGVEETALGLAALPSVHKLLARKLAAVTIQLLWRLRDKTLSRIGI